MNYFGLFFSFALPGAVIGLLAGLALAEHTCGSKRGKTHERGVEDA